MKLVEVFYRCLIIGIIRHASTSGLAVPYNQPKLCPNASWDPNAITFINSSVVSSTSYKIFVNTNNTIYLANSGKDEILVFSEGNVTPIRNISILGTPWTLFVSSSGDIYVEGPSGIDKVNLTSTVGIPIWQMCQLCYDIFIDINDLLYCSVNNKHQVIARSLMNDSAPMIIVAGTGFAGKLPNMLNQSTGIFVDTNFDLYVADRDNDRIQLFRSGQLIATTVAGNTSLNSTIALNKPTAVVLDADQYLFIADSDNNRIVGSGPNGFRCIVGCSNTSGSSSYQLNKPFFLSFDRDGNIFVMDFNNGRIQKFILMTNSCYGTILIPQNSLSSTMNNLQLTTINPNHPIVSPSSNMSYNRPKLDPFASWSANAITFASSSTIGTGALAIFVDTNNTVYLSEPSYGRIHVWKNGNSTPTSAFWGNFSMSLSIVVATTGDVYFDNTNPGGQVEKWITGTNISVPAMYSSQSCGGLSIDVNNILYCSMGDRNQVVSRPLSSTSYTLTIVAGTGCSGSASNMLNFPHGIFVDTNLDLYVADCYNHRIQLFRSGQFIGITVAGSASVNITITLDRPTDVILDGDGYLFIVDHGNSRIVASGPYGFRCVAGCSGSSGSATNQLDRPQRLAFDSDGNFFVTDWWNNRIQKFILLNKTLTPSYCQPKLPTNASWNPNATTFANSSIVGLSPWGLFVTVNNTIYVADEINHRVQIWSSNSLNPTKTISGGLSLPRSIFVTDSGDLFVDNGHANRRVDKWNVNTNTSVPVMYVSSSCFGLFIDVTNTVYCSMPDNHQVVKRWLNDHSNLSTTVAGTGAAGSTPTMLNRPYGIFVDTNIDLYVADCNNDRIQLFRLGQLNGITVAGNESINTTITLDCPSSIVLDADGYLFIVEWSNHRIVGSGPNGFHCIVGYQNNNRIQKFLLNKPSDESSTSSNMASTTMVQTTTQIRRETSRTSPTNQQCFPPIITLVPSTSTISSPLEYQRNQDFFISSNIQLDCNVSLSTIMQWTITNCTSTCSSSLSSFDQSIQTTFSELYVPAQTLPLGTYELKLTVSMTASSTLRSSTSAFVEIIASGITVNLVQLGTSQITIGYQQDLKLDPGSFSVDPDEDVFNGSDWSYKYHCRIYGLSDFPKIGGSLLTIDDPRVDPQNPSCLSNTNRTAIEYVGIGPGSRSSIIIRAGSLRSNRTYQFMTEMQHRRDNRSQATGDVLVQVVDRSLPIIAVGCVISTMCVANAQFQRINPTTQVALFALCLGNCVDILHITWNIYQGVLNTSTNTSQWISFNQMSHHQNSWFFGGNTTKFTASSQLFLSSPNVSLWRFEVVYTFLTGSTSSGLNFAINQPPRNGTCSINPRNGTTSTLFNILCLNWFDTDGIKGYSLYSWTNDRSQPMIISFSPVSTFEVRLPVGNDQTSLLHLIVRIGDTRQCITEIDITSVYVQPDSEGINDLLNSLQSPSLSTSNPIGQLLASGNQNIVGQVISSVSEQFNKKNSESMNSAVSSGVSAASISIAPLGGERTQIISVPLNETAATQFEGELNSYANVRDYLMQFTTNLAISTADSIKLQASSLAQLTQATNQLTRTALITASDRCYRLSFSLQSMSGRIPSEDVQTAVRDLSQCAINILSAVNGPLQGRTTVLELDLSRSTSLPDDYETDIESEWSNPNLFVDGNDFSSESIERGRNLFYQKQLANEMTHRMNEILSLLSSAMNIHLNMGQHSIINTPNVYLSMEIVSTNGLINKTIEQVGNAQIEFPSELNLSVNENSTISVRSTVEPLSPLGTLKSSSSNTNLSTSISLSLFDENGNEISIETNSADPIELIIPRDPNVNLPSWTFQNTSSISSSAHNQIYNLHYMNISSEVNRSIHWEIQPLDRSVAYQLIYKFDQSPQLNSSVTVIDGWTLLCPSNLTNESIYQYYVDNLQSFGHRSLIFGLRELNCTEEIELCSSVSLRSAPITDERYNFTSTYHLRVYTSGCYYLSERNEWKSDGLIVGPKTNLVQTQCLSSHLSKFSGGYQVLPSPINWNYVFANGDFLKNKTIYLTVICVCVIYLILLIYCRYKDRQDLQRLGVTPMVDNHPSDQYLYQILVFTGQRKDSGTKSKVHFVIYGDDDETRIRTLEDPHRSILQRGGIDSFVMSVPKSLGLLNCIRIWHDNSGGSSSSSWFLKYLIIRDLQTMEKFHFICQRWFAVEKDDGKIERVLGVAGELEKNEFSYVLSKGAYRSVSDGHLWFSIFSHRPSIEFSRVQRCTCCFVLLMISMLLNIMYYDLSNRSKSSNSTESGSLVLGPIYLSVEQVMIGVIVEVLSLIPSLLIVQIFRRVRPRRKLQSPLREALHKIRSNVKIKEEVDPKSLKVKSGIRLPWWWVLIGYGLCLMFVGVSVVLIIARGIEFGDLKSQQWLGSILTGLFSSIFVSQPLKIICLAIFFAYFCRKSDNDEDVKEILNGDQIDIEKDEEYLHSLQSKSLFTYRTPVRADRLNAAEVAMFREKRVQEIRMWSILHEMSICVGFFCVLCLIVYSTRPSNGFNQVQHLRNYFLRSRELSVDYSEITTIGEYWNWLEKDFVEKIRAQQWYNKDPPRHLSGYLNDKSNRLIGWPTIRQLRMKSHLCSYKRIRLNCFEDYQMLNEDKDSFYPDWVNETLSLSIVESFRYKRSEELDTYLTVGEHGSYSGNGFVYEFRGRLNEMKENLSKLHELEWINNSSRALIIQLNLFNPNVELFTSVILLSEFLSSGGIFSSIRIEPFHLNAFNSQIQLICGIIYLILIFYMLISEIRRLIQMKSSYFRRFQSYIELSLIVFSWTSLGIYIWFFLESKRIGKLFRETNGYVYINLQFSSYVNDVLTYMLGLCCFFGTIKLSFLCRFDYRLLFFSRTLRRASKSLISFSLMFCVVFFSFVCLFYLLFNSHLQSCSTLFETSRMLFEMTLMKFDAHQLIDAAPFLGPLAFCLFILLVVFVCMSMFLSIITDSFRQARDQHHGEKDEQLFLLMIDKFLRWTGLRKPTAEEIHEEWDAKMRQEYFDPIERFPERIDQLLNAINRLYLQQISGRS